MWRSLLIVCCLLACKKAPPPPPPAPARFCDVNLSGVWLNASDRHFAYRFRDHGDVIRGEFLEAQEDGGLTKPDDPVSFELHRTEAALAGVMRMTQKTQGGRDCPVEFGIDVTVCRSESLQATVEMDAPIGEDCKRKFAEDGGDLPTHRTEFVFVRDSKHPSDGGEDPVSH